MYKPTGTNVTPLGAKRRFTESHKTEEYPKTDDHRRDRPDGNHSFAPPSQHRNDSPSNDTTPTTADGSTPKRKRKSRWGDEQKVILPGLPTSVSKLTKEQSEKYLLQIRLEEVNTKLRNNDFLPSDQRERSRSPEPIYNAEGKRTNTREARHKKKLEDERHKLIETAMKTIPNYRPPIDYKRPTKTQEKVYIPDKEFPEINFIGQLIGPRGNTLKTMESESGAKISIRGRGSVKEGKSRTDAAANSGQEEDLHCLVTADTEEKVRKAVKLIEKVIETSASVPEGQNELKRNQLRELAALNGTLRDDENQTCLNCGGAGHRRYECTESQNITTTLVCKICEGGGHIARDCNLRNNPELVNQARERDSKLDSEYMNLMAELGESVPEGGQRSYGDNRSGGSSAPWQQRPSSGSPAGTAAPPWQQNKSNAPPPWSSGSSGYNNAPPKEGPPGTTAPWSTPAPPQGGYPAYGGSDYYNSGYGSYSGYGGYYDQSAQAPPPPGSSASAPWQQSLPPPPPPGSSADSWGMPPPPPPSFDDSAPPPPPSSEPAPPPPPPSA